MIEPVTSISGLTRYTPDDDAAVIDPADYMVVTRDPSGTIIAPHDRNGWPAAERSIGSFATHLRVQAGRVTARNRA